MSAAIISRQWQIVMAKLDFYFSLKALNWDLSLYHFVLEKKLLAQIKIKINSSGFY